MSVSFLQEGLGPHDDAAAAINFASLLHKIDSDFATAPRHVIGRFHFTLDGLPYDVRRIANEKEYHFLINVLLGYLPFSIESPERREAIRAIVAASENLPTVRLSIGPDSKITAGALFKGMIEPPDFAFYPLMLFLQEARPFMNLLSGYLNQATAAPKPLPERQTARNA